ncbi:MAG: nucleoside deaminase [Deltaproteobacteria bacterium]|nr:nucleoside deaminase [Deltaproteobacteria bacterium]
MAVPCQVDPLILLERLLCYVENLSTINCSEVNIQDLFYMKLALKEAASAGEAQEIPVGAVVVYRGEVIGRGHNRREQLQSPVAHAEILALQEAASRLRSWRLCDCTLYVTLEPCIMCVGAVLQARIPRLVFGCLDPKGGAVESLYRLCDDSRLNHSVAVTSGVLADDCGQILSRFFARMREKKSTTTADSQLNPHSS